MALERQERLVHVIVSKHHTHGQKYDQSQNAGSSMNEHLHSYFLRCRRNQEEDLRSEVHWLQMR